MGLWWPCLLLCAFVGLPWLDKRPQKKDVKSMWHLERRVLRVNVSHEVYDAFYDIYEDSLRFHHCGKAANYSKFTKHESHRSYSEHPWSSAFKNPAQAGPFSPQEHHRMNALSFSLQKTLCVSGLRQKDTTQSRDLIIHFPDMPRPPCTEWDHYCFHFSWNLLCFCKVSSLKTQETILNVRAVRPGEIWSRLDSVISIKMEMNHTSVPLQTLESLPVAIKILFVFHFSGGKKNPGLSLCTTV